MRCYACCSRAEVEAQEGPRGVHGPREQPCHRATIVLPLCEVRGHLHCSDLCSMECPAGKSQAQCYMCENSCAKRKEAYHGAACGTLAHKGCKLAIGMAHEPAADHGYQSVGGQRCKPFPMVRPWAVRETGMGFPHSHPRAPASLAEYPPRHSHSSLLAVAIPSPCRSSSGALIGLRAWCRRLVWGWRWENSTYPLLSLLSPDPRFLPYECWRVVLGL